MALIPFSSCVAKCVCTCAWQKSKLRLTPSFALPGLCCRVQVSNAVASLRALVEQKLFKKLFSAPSARCYPSALAATDMAGPAGIAWGNWQLKGLGKSRPGRAPVEPTPAARTLARSVTRNPPMEQLPVASAKPNLAHPVWHSSRRPPAPAAQPSSKREGGQPRLCPLRTKTCTSGGKSVPTASQTWHFSQPGAFAADSLQLDAATRPCRRTRPSWLESHPFRSNFVGKAACKLGTAREPRISSPVMNLDLPQNRQAGYLLACSGQGLLVLMAPMALMASAPVASARSFSALKASAPRAAACLATSRVSRPWLRESEALSCRRRPSGGDCLRFLPRMTASSTGRAQQPLTVPGRAWSGNATSAGLTLFLDVNDAKLLWAFAMAGWSTESTAHPRPLLGRTPAQPPLKRRQMASSTFWPLACNASAKVDEKQREASRACL